VAQREIEPVALEILHLDVRGDAHVHSRVIARKASKARDQP
jgi:hypothetical protein